MNFAALAANFILGIGVVFIGCILGIAIVRFWLYKTSDYEKDFYQD